MNKQSMLRMARPVLAGLAIALAAPGVLTAQESGADVWARACGRCHRIQPPTRYDARHWEAIIGHMALNARLTTDEEAAVREFLMGAARRIAVRPEEEVPRELGQLASLDLSAIVALTDSDGAELFKRQCVACHGDSGEGNGPAAVAFNPKPADLTDGKVIGALTDDELVGILSGGKGSMPAFSALLTPDQIRTLVGYIRTLSRDP